MPGTRISTANLQLRFDVSLGAVREALLQLAADNLAIAVDRRGFHVAPVSVPDLEDLARSRAEIETSLIRDAIANSTSASEGEILAALHRLEGIPRNADGTSAAEWYDEHRRFHAALVGASTSRWMGRFRATLHDQFERYCRISMVIRHTTKAKDRHSHRALAEAMLAPRCRTRVRHHARTHLGHRSDRIVLRDDRAGLMISRHAALGKARELLGE